MLMSLDCVDGILYKYLCTIESVLPLHDGPLSTQVHVLASSIAAANKAVKVILPGQQHMDRENFLPLVGKVLQ